MSETIATTITATATLKDELTSKLEAIIKVMGQVKAAAPGMMSGAEKEIAKFNSSIGALESKLGALSKMFVSPKVDTAGITAAIAQATALQGTLAGIGGGGMGGGMPGRVSSTSRGVQVPAYQQYSAGGPGRAAPMTGFPLHFNAGTGDYVRGPSVLMSDALRSHEAARIERGLTGMQAMLPQTGGNYAGFRDARNAYLGMTSHRDRLAQGSEAWTRSMGQWGMPQQAHGIPSGSMGQIEWFADTTRQMKIQQGMNQTAANYKAFLLKNQAAERDVGGRSVQDNEALLRQYSRSAIQARGRQMQMESAGVGYSGRSASGYAGANPVDIDFGTPGIRPGFGERMWWGSGGRPPVGSAGTPSGPVAKVGRGVGFAVGKVAGGFGSAATYALPYAAFRQITAGVGAVLTGTGGTEYVDPAVRMISSGGSIDDIRAAEAEGMLVEAQTGGQILSTDFVRYAAELMSTPSYEGLSREQIFKSTKDVALVGKLAGMGGDVLIKQMPLIIGAIGDHPDLAGLAPDEKKLTILKIFRSLERRFSLRGQDMLEFLKYAGPAIIHQKAPLIETLTRMAVLHSHGLKASTMGRTYSKGVGDRSRWPLLKMGRKGPSDPKHGLGGPMWLNEDVHNLSKKERAYIDWADKSGTFKFYKGRTKTIDSHRLVAFNKATDTAKMFTGPKGEKTLDVGEYEDFLKTIPGAYPAALMEGILYGEEHYGPTETGKHMGTGLSRRELVYDTKEVEKEVARKTREVTGAVAQPGIEGEKEFYQLGKGPQTVQTSAKRAMSALGYSLFGRYAPVEEIHDYFRKVGEKASRIRSGESAISGITTKELITMGVVAAGSGLGGIIGSFLPGKSEVNVPFGIAAGGGAAYLGMSGYFPSPGNLALGAARWAMPQDLMEEEYTEPYTGLRVKRPKKGTSSMFSIPDDDWVTGFGDTDIGEKKAVGGEGGGESASSLTSLFQPMSDAAGAHVAAAGSLDKAAGALTSAASVLSGISINATVSGQVPQGQSPPLPTHRV
jgi:hypothetical protein